MEAKDLMIGDWVYILNFPEVGKKTPVKIVGINTNHNAVEYVHNGIRLWSVVVRLEPIPITPEILVKNGFEPNEFTLYYLPIKDGSIRFSEHQYGLYCNIIRSYQKYDGVCNYVHELQNALRLCGIEKEITI